jgi:hypothetical protein
MTMHAHPTSPPYETGTTAGASSLRTPGAFFRRFRTRAADDAAKLARPQALFADKQWLVTYERPNGDIATEAVLINGGNLQADIDTLARLALRDQRDIDCANIIRISIDYRATPARIEALNRISRDYSARLKFEAECG